MHTLYVGFKGKNNTSFQLISRLGCERLFLTNSLPGLIRDISALDQNYDSVTMFGLDKTLSNCVRIETKAELQGSVLCTALPVEQLADRFTKNGIRCSISDVPTRYLCNEAYYRMLQKTVGKAVFVHIPGIRYMTENMMNGILKVLGE